MFQFPIAREVQWNPLGLALVHGGPQVFQFPIAREVQWNYAAASMRTGVNRVSVPYRSGSPVEQSGWSGYPLAHGVSVPYRSGSPVELPATVKHIVFLVFQFPIAREVQWNHELITPPKANKSEFQFPIAREVQWNPLPQ